MSECIKDGLTIKAPLGSKENMTKEDKNGRPVHDNPRVKRHTKGTKK